METYYSSIFNEVFGPVMVGTSSSHTAGPYRIGAMARMLLKDPVKKDEFPLILTVHMHHITNCSGLTEDLLQVCLDWQLIAKI